MLSPHSDEPFPELLRLLASVIENESEVCNVSLNASFLRDLAVRLELLEASVAELLPMVMAYWSEDIWCAGWMQNLDSLLTEGDRKIPMVVRAANLLGRIPTYSDYNDSLETVETEWREFSGMAETEREKWRALSERLLTAWRNDNGQFHRKEAIAKYWPEFKELE